MSALPGILTRNWTLKLSAFGIALLLWVSVRVEAPSRQILEGVPVRVDLGDPEWALVEEPDPATAVVRFHGPSRELLSMALGDRPSIVIPLDRVHAADTTIVLGTHHVRFQDRTGVNVDDIQPGTVQLAFEPVERLDVPVAVRLEGELPSEWALAAPAAPDPASVRAIGPASRVQALDSVRLRPLPLAEVEEPGRYRVGLDTVGLAGVQLQPGDVAVDLSLEERVERSVAGVPVVVDLDGWREVFEVEPETGSVRVIGARSLVEAFDPQSLRLVVQVDNGELPNSPGEELEVSPRMDGVPELLHAEPEVGPVTLRRLDEEGA